MIRRKRDRDTLELIGNNERDAADDDASAAELLREVLKELRQIRGILGHLAKDVAKESVSARADEPEA